MSERDVELTSNPTTKSQSQGEEKVTYAPIDFSWEDRSSWFGFFTLSFLNPLFVRGFNKTLTPDDIGKPANQDRCDEFYQKFVNEWHEEQQKPVAKQSLLGTLLRTMGYRRLFWALFINAINEAVGFGPILILNILVKHFQGTERLSVTGLWICVCLMLALPVVCSVCFAHSNVILGHMGLQSRNILVEMIYRKTLVLSSSSRSSSSTGQIINMFTNDSYQIAELFHMCNRFIMAGPMIAVGLYLVYREVGPATFVGLGLLLIGMPLNAIVFAVVVEQRKKKVHQMDIRVKLMNEILNGIRIIKYYAWEKPFQQKVEEVRQSELKILNYLTYVAAIGFSISFQALPLFQPVLIFYTYIKLGHKLDAATAFTTLALFSYLEFPLVSLPRGIVTYIQATIASKRVVDFLRADELQGYVIRDRPAAHIAIRMEDASLGWVKEEINVVLPANSNSSTGKYQQVDSQDTSTLSDDKLVPTISDDKSLVNRSLHTLRSVNFDIEQGQLVAIVGPVGSGKSSILSALLGEMMLQKGKVYIDGSIAYCDQRAWILNDTVQGNILFGLALDEQRLKRAVYAASLETDLAILPGGIHTQIGERGINLSGGQKARVALARAIYRDADIYLLDDPLSAVDAHVGQFLFQECIVKSLAGKTRLLVTHQIQNLPNCDKIIIVEDGDIKACGSYESIVQSGVDFSQYFPKKEEDNVAGNGDKSVAAMEAVTTKEGQSMQTVQTTDDIVVDNDITAVKDEEQKPAAAILTEEEQGEGRVSWSVYSYVIRIGGLLNFSSFFGFLLVTQVCAVLATFWLQYWGLQSVDAQKYGEELSSADNLYYVTVYALINVVAVFGFVLKAFSLATWTLVASSAIHSSLLARVLAAPIAFFDTTPTGRIINRFSSDLSTVDEELPPCVSEVFDIFLSVLGAIGAIAGATKGTVLILVAPLSVFYCMIDRYFRATNTAISRLEKVARSPIISDFSQVLNGVSSVRAYSQETRFINRLEYAVDNFNAIYFMRHLVTQWLVLRLDFIGSLVSFFVALLAVASDDFIPAGFLAVGLVCSFRLTTFLKYLVYLVANWEAQMSSIERIQYYVQHIEQEALGLEDTSSSVPATWPECGIVEARDAQLRYRDGPLVLSGVNFITKASEKVGIVGRTGSGKSSLMAALFRIEELAGGSMKIDGIDTSAIPLTLLRSKLGIIPQDPVMFSATVRFNLDPFKLFTDTEIWEVLEHVHMKEHVLSLPKKLEEDVAEGGDNFSAGQRQLICIARAILRKPKILVLDEATASIDNETDEMVQQTISSLFKHCTVLTIAHRLNTIRDSDRIMVLDQGKVVELDTPDVLLSREDGVFKALWDRHCRSHGVHS